MKRKNLKVIPAMLLLVLMILFIFLSMACFPKYIGSCFLDLKAEWTSDELTLETTGNRDDNMVFGKLTLYGEEIEVGCAYYYTRMWIFVYKKSDIEAKGMDENGKYRAPDMSKSLFHCYCKDVKPSYFSKNIKKVKLEVSDYYSETVGQEDRTGETWVLTRQDLS